MKIFLIGFMGSGKTTVGKRLAKQLNLDFLDLDEIVEKKYQMTISSIFKRFGESVFRDLETTVLKEVTKEEDNFVLSCGGGTPCYNSNMEIINNSGVSIYLRMDEKALAHRIENSYKKRPLVDDITRENLINYISKTLDIRENFYNSAKYVVNALNIDINKISELLKNNSDIL